MTDRPLPRGLGALARCAVAAALIAAFAEDASAQLVVNEIDYDQPSTDTAEFIEIKNVSAGTIDLDPYALTLVNGTGGGAAVYATIDLPAFPLAAGGYFVVCANAANTVACDFDVTPDSNLIQNGDPDAVAITLAGVVVDTVSYGGNTGAPYTEGSGTGLDDPSGAADAFLGLARFPDGADTGSNNVDLSARCITPGAANGVANSACPAPGTPRLVINEVDYDQPGTDTAEFVEIYNAGTAAADLDPYTLQLVNGTGGGAVAYANIDLPAVSLPPGGFFVVCGDAANTLGCDLDVTPDSNLIQNGDPDAVALVLAGVVVDTVSYGGDSGAPYTEGSGTGLDDPSGAADAFLGLSRLPDGADTNVNNVDFTVRCVTPGAPNSAETAGCAAPVEAVLVINEIDYDQPGTDGAEFVEIKNAGPAAVDLDPYSLVLVNGNGGGAVVYLTIDLPAVSLAAGDYFVVCGNAATVDSCDLDVSPDTNLVQNGDPDAVAIVLAGVVVDTVSYGGNTGAPYTEGSGAGLDDPALAGDELLGLSRSPDGLDSDQNALDFAVRCITPGEANSATDTGCGVVGGTFEIFAIQGPGLASPFAGAVVTTEDNVVTELAPDGFFIQTPDERADLDPETSNGLFVFTGGAPPVGIGDRVDVTGTVQEFFDWTEIGGGPTVTLRTIGNPLPVPVAFNASVPSPNQPQPATELERYENMRVQVAAGTVSGPNQRFGSDPIAEVHVVAGPARAFREPGVLFPGLPGIPVWDGNPEVFELDPNRLGLANALIPAGSTFEALGVLGFEFGGYELFPSFLAFDPATLPRPVSIAGTGEFTVGSLNLFRLFDDVDDPGPQDDGAVVSTAEYQRRLEKFSRHIREILRAPDVLAVEECEKLANLAALAARIAADDPAVVYSAYLVEGNDVGGIDTGFLVRDTVDVVAVTQLAAGEIFTFDGSLLHDRPPLLLEAVYTGGGAEFPISVLALHQRSLGGIEDPADGPRVRLKRLEQAQSVAAIVQGLQTADPAIKLVVVGDFNAFQFSDGYVDVVGQIAGEFDPADNELSGPDLVDPNLTKQTLSLPASEQYSFIFAGSAQAIDHALTSAALDPLVRGFEYGRGNADAAGIYLDDATTPLRSSDHDGLVLRIFADGDGDGIGDARDFCEGTVIPESVPTVSLGILRYALVDGDATFDTRKPFPSFPAPVFTLTDTAGCSCEQIIDELHLGSGHEKFGCGLGVMAVWKALVAHHL